MFFFCFIYITKVDGRVKASYSDVLHFPLTEGASSTLKNLKPASDINFVKLEVKFEEEVIDCVQVLLLLLLFSFIFIDARK